MNNINFSNPWLLLVGLFLLVVILVSFFIFIKKEGFNFHNITTLIIHCIIVIFVTIAASGMTLELNITETDVYVLADCSYSSYRNLDTIDSKIKDLSKNLPNNSKLGVITYGKDYELITPLGSKFSSVQSTTIDDTQTNVRPALEYAVSLFNDDAIKRIVVITDGLETSSSSISGLINDYETQDIHIDAIYLDNSLKDGVYEYQLTSVSYNDKTYLNRSEEAVVTIDSNMAVDSVDVKISTYDSLVASESVSLVKGSNKVTFTLPTTSSGHKEYTVTVNDPNSKSTDTNPYNNSYTFTQDVSDKISVLFLSNDSQNGESELNYFKTIYSSNLYDITSYVNDDSNVPVLLDDLCKYDEIVLDNFNVDANDFQDQAVSFVTNLNLAVSEYGKTLHTFGNSYVQNTEGDDVLKSLGDMLPISFTGSGNAKSYTILIDVSNSMQQISHLSIAKQCAIKLLNLLNESDYFTVIAFYGNMQIVSQGQATEANVLKATNAINELTGKQATNIQAALEYAYTLLANTNYKYKKVMLITDGLDYSNGSQGSVAKLTEMFSEQFNKNVETSCICVNENYTEGSTTNSSIDVINALVSCGGTATKITSEEDVNGAKFGEIKEQEIEVYKSGSTYSVETKNKNSEVLDGMQVTASVTSFYAGSAKSSANTILNVKEKGVKYPLYSTWNFGEGSVTSYTTLLKDYAKTSGTNQYKFLSNIVSTYTPSIQTTAPYKMNVEVEGNTVSVTLESQTINPQADITLSVKKGGDTVGSYKFSANSSNYFTTFDIEEVGTYTLTMNYNNVSLKSYYTLSYYSEYDSFVESDTSFLYSLITSDGNVIEEGNLVINNDNLAVTKYKYTFAPLMMILSVILFVCDVAIRKLKWQDIVSLFKKQKKVK